MGDTIIIPAEIMSMMNDKTDSVGISKNSKGYTWDIKIYTKNLTDEATQQAVLNKIKEIDTKLQQQFPSA